MGLLRFARSDNKKSEAVSPFSASSVFTQTRTMKLLHHFVPRNGGKYVRRLSLRRFAPRSDRERVPRSDEKETLAGTLKKPLAVAPNPPPQGHCAAPEAVLLSGETAFPTTS